MNLKSWIQFGIFLGLFLVMGSVLFLTPNLLPAVLLSLVAYYLLYPVIFWGQKKGLTWQQSAVLVYCCTGFVLLGALLFAVPILVVELREFIERAPELLTILQSQISTWSGNWEHRWHFSLSQQLWPTLQPQLVAWLTQLAKQAPKFVSQSLVLLFLSPLFTFFFITQGPHWPEQISRQLPPSYDPYLRHWLKDINQQVGGFIRARLIESILVGLLTWIGLQFVGLPFAVLVALGAAVLNIVPYVGPVLASIPAFLLALAMPEASSAVLGVALVFGLVQALDAFILVPFLVARLVRLHALVVIIAILLGGQLMGIMGMIISIPLASLFKVTWVHIQLWINTLDS